MTTAPPPGPRQGALTEVLVRLGADPDAADAVEADLRARWSEPHRRYHDLRHLAEVLERVEALAGHAEHPDTVRLAAWWHDAVHDGRAGDDERASAVLAREQLRTCGLPGRLQDAVADLVLVTVAHDPGDPPHPDAAVLCDADLGVLAAMPARYKQYAADVRDEYAHVPDDLFAVGRAAVLRRLLARPLFRSPGARGWEATARDNVARELAALVPPTSGTTPDATPDATPAATTPEHPAAPAASPR